MHCLFHAFCFVFHTFTGYMFLYLVHGGSSGINFLRVPLAGPFCLFIYFLFDCLPCFFWILIQKSVSASWSCSKASRNMAVLFLFPFYWDYCFLLIINNEEIWCKTKGPWRTCSFYETSECYLIQRLKQEKSFRFTHKIMSRSGKQDYQKGGN